MIWKNKNIHKDNSLKKDKNIISLCKHKNIINATKLIVLEAKKRGTQLKSFH